MSDAPQGPGWWQASDGKWYPPEQAPAAPPTPPGQVPGQPAPAYGAPAPGAPAPGTLADWPLRAQSAVVDWFGPNVVAGVLFQVSDALGVLAWLAALGWAFYNGYLAGETGQSYGKKWAGTRLVSEQTGQNVGGVNGAVRHLAHIVDAVICYIGFLFPLWDTKRQTIADKIMKTLVVTT